MPPTALSHCFVSHVEQIHMTACWFQGPEQILS